MSRLARYERSALGILFQLQSVHYVGVLSVWPCARSALAQTLPSLLANPSVMLPNPVYHQVAFALIMIFSILRAGQLSLRLPTALRSKIGRTLGGGVAVFVAGFAIWNADNYFCVYLRSTRQWLTDAGVGSLGHFTEGHGYWHLMTGYGAYRIFTACIGESVYPSRSRGRASNEKRAQADTQNYALRLKRPRPTGTTTRRSTSPSSTPSAPRS